MSSVLTDYSVGNKTIRQDVTTYPLKYLVYIILKKYF